MCYNNSMDTELKNKLDILEQKLDKANKDIKTIKNVFLWTFILTLLLIILPLIAMVFIIPNFISSIVGTGGNSADYNSFLNSLGI